jgi:hypothetical protein
MKHAIWQLSTVQLDPGPHSSMEHPPPEHDPSLQVALAPSHFMKQPPAQSPMPQVLPAVQVLIEHPPPVHASKLHLALLPVHASEQPPMQLLTVHEAP